MGERRIEVNIPDFSVAVMEGDTVVHQARVIVGKPDTPTPIFSNVMRYVLINPSWQVPDSIIKKEMMSEARLPGPPRVRGQDRRRTADRASAAGRRQRARPNSPSCFRTTIRSTCTIRRLASCSTRMRAPSATAAFESKTRERLAELVLEGGTSGWTAERIEAAIGGPERTVFLPRPLPIHIEYFTEFVNEFGELQERADIYGLTRRVEGILPQPSQD